MHNPRLAGRYAKSLLDLAKEQNNLEQIYQDMLFLQSIVRSNRDFVNLLRSPVVKADKKEKIINAVTASSVSPLTTAFIRLLTHKGRESSLPEIITAFIEQYKDFKGIYSVFLKTAVPVSEEVKQAITRKVEEQVPGKTIDLEASVKENLIGGFTLQMGDTLIDASIAYDLNKIKAQFMNNDFVYKIR